MAVAITRASPDRLAALAAVLGRSFVVEPMMCWSLGYHDNLEERLIRCFEYFLEGLIPLGLVWEAGACDGASVWISPDAADAWSQAQTRDRRVDALTLDGGRRYAAFWEWVESRIPDEPLWHLDSVAVDPGTRGRGIGSALIEHGLERARADVIASMLETGNAGNVPYYERFGIRVVDEVDTPGDGPRVWFMRKDP
jgi:ribosomal protein S18 acetylase RimI-like enzyme